MQTRQAKSHSPNTAPTKTAEAPQKAAVSAASAARVPAWKGGMNDQIPPGLVLQDASAIQGIQAKLAISQPDDRYEQEADRVAEQVMRMPATGPSMGNNNISLMRKEEGGEKQTTGAPSIVSEVLNTEGQPLGEDVQTSMESSFAQDFSQVRVHTDGQAAESAQSVSALAYTAGNDVVFGSGQYRPETSEGQKLLAHELTHVVQQQGSTAIQRQKAETGSEEQKKTSQQAQEAELREEQTALQRISKLLSTGIFDWSVSKSEALQVLTILQHLAPEALLSVIRDMKMGDKWRKFVEALPESGRADLGGLEITIDPNVGYIMPGDEVRLEFPDEKLQEKSAEGEGSPTSGENQTDYNVTSAGITPLYLSRPVNIVGLLPQNAVNTLAQAYIDSLVYWKIHLRLMVTKRGAKYAPYVGPTAQTFWFTTIIGASAGSPEMKRRQKQVEFMDYIRLATVGDELTTSARAHYLSWIEKNYTKPEFLSRTPADLWKWALSQASTPLPASPAQPFLDLTRSMIARLDTAAPEDKPVIQGALDRYLAWVDKHLNDPNIGKFDPVEIWAEAYRHAFQMETSRKVERAQQESRERAASSPEAIQAQASKYQEFYKLAFQLLAYSARTFPYVIPIPSEGRDILVTGDPARQHVLNNLANALVDWATKHVLDQNFASVNPKAVLVDLLHSGYDHQLEEANKQPLENESIDRHELIPGRVLAKFGETVATGLLIVGLVGAVVGLGIITGGAAAVILLGAAGWSGVSSYLTRRKEIENSNYDVPIPETMLHSVGDVVGLSQLIEGISGERLGTGRRLNSIERSDELGTGAGNVTLLLVGSKAYRAGQSFGQNVRLGLPGKVPAGPEGNVPLQHGPVKPPPEPSANPGPLESQIRAKLPQELRGGFDDYVGELKRKGHNPEEALKKIPENKRLDVIRREAAKRVDEFQEEVKKEYARMRSADNPLKPIMRKVEKVPDSKVTLRYNTKMPSAEEIAQALEISRRTGEPVDLFGDTAGGNEYPGIDGTIGDPPRPLSLKEANIKYARLRAQQALELARTHGYSHVEVHIRVKGSTVGEIQSAWENIPPETKTPLSPVFDSADTVSRIVIQADEGVWVLKPELKGPSLPGVGVPVGGKEEKK